MSGTPPSPEQPRALRSGQRPAGRRITVGSRPSAVVATDEAVWVANASDGTVSKVDPSSGAVVDTIDVGSDPESLAIGGDAVGWRTRMRARVADRSRIRRRRANDRGRQRSHRRRGILQQHLGGQQRRRYRAAPGSRGWRRRAADRRRRVPVGHHERRRNRLGGQQVRRHRLRDRRRLPTSDLDKIHVGTDPSGVASVDGGVWVTNRSDGTASFVAAGAAAVSDTMPAGRDPHTIAVASDDVWVASADDGTIWQLGSGQPPGRRS